MNSWLSIDDWWMRTTTATVDGTVYRTDGDASVNLVYHNQHGRPRRREQNLFVRGGKSEAEVARRLRSRRFVLLKLTADRHEASRSLSATAELLVSKNLNVFSERYVVRTAIEIAFRPSVCLSVCHTHEL